FNETDLHIYMLVRGESDAIAKQKMLESAAFWGIAEQALVRRGTVLRGDVEANDFGLSGEQLEAILPELQYVIHSASSIHLNRPIEVARRSIVGGLKHALELAKRAPQLRCFGYLSTLEIVGKYEGLFPERFASDIPRAFLNTYEAAKAEAEAVLEAESKKESHVPFAVFRPSMVVGQASDGRALTFQSFYLMLERMLIEPLGPVAPHGCPVDTIPVDVLARGIRVLCGLMTKGHAVYHFAQGIQDKLPFSEFVALAQPALEHRLKRSIQPPRFLPVKLFIYLLSAARYVTFGSLARSVRTQLMFIRFLELEWNFDTENTREALRCAGVEQPKFEEYLGPLLDYYLANRSENRLPI
ncbi:MAG: SDR family oxidoreductase, partial [Bdellovibrionales bacterium]|nr:SDR family oxidoreductase [Bdellovibrionales bacterium]